MSYQIQFLKRAASELSSRVSRAIAELAENPRPNGVEPVKSMPGHLRIRAGDYRVIYLVRDDVLVIVVVRIGHRREVYR